ncbi:MAG: DUF2628 domain-containing protein [Clostridia bacterium]|nr:DUF2628 domain-containing protein [Clostridia bacterium]
MKCNNCGMDIVDTSNFCNGCGAKVNVQNLGVVSVNQQPIVEQNNVVNTNNANFSSAAVGVPMASVNINTGVTQPGFVNTNVFSEPQTAYNNVANDMPKRRYAGPKVYYDNAEDDINLIDEYMGKNANSIRNCGFSVPMFFFGYYYLLYRKMYFLAMVFLILSAIFAAIPGGVGMLIWLGMNIFMALKFNEWYLDKARTKIVEIRSQHITRRPIELVDICKKKGGTSIVAPIVGSFLPFILAMVLLVIYFWDYIYTILVVGILEGMSRL